MKAALRGPAPTNVSRRGDGVDQWFKGRMVGIVATTAVVLIAWAVAVTLPTLSSSLIVPVLGSIAAVFATIALVGLVGLMLKDVKVAVQSFNRRDKESPRWHSDSRFWYASGSGGMKHR